MKQRPSLLTPWAWKGHNKGILWKALFSQVWNKRLEYTFYQNSHKKKHNIKGLYWWNGIRRWPSKQKVLDPDKFTKAFDQTFKEEIISILYNLFQKIQVERQLPNISYGASITLTLKPDKYITRKKNYRPLSLVTQMKKSSTKH